MSSLQTFLKSLDLERYLPTFIENEVDLETLRILKEEDLKELDLPFGPRKRILNAFAEQGTQAAARPEERAGQRRQVTVLFADMVGFTELANRVDPEVLERIIRAYEDVCTACVKRFNGYVFQLLGDGIVAFFGVPLAHEGEAERAVRAGLEILESLRRLETEIGQIRVRIGVATGVVVVISAEKGAVGETMNLASRLQGVAEPGSLVVSERVYRLAGGAFEYEDLGELHLKGIQHPTRAYRVMGASLAESRFDAANASGISPLVGRDAEMAELLMRWKQARESNGQTVLISGEAGIGKSRLIRALQEHLKEESLTVLRYQCSPFYLSTAYHPISSALERTLAFEREETVDSRLDKIEMLMRSCGQPIQDARFLATMLSVPCEARYGPLNMAPQLVKAETHRVLLETLAGLLRRQPGLLLFEDLHWADPTSLEVLGEMIERSRTLPLLLVLTHRPDFEPPWKAQDSLCELSLVRMTHEESAAIISRIARGKSLPGEMTEQIIARSDGIPLFVEELTKTILETGDLMEEADRYVYRGSSSGVPIPEALRDSLSARLDQVPMAKEVAQTGAAIGREFTWEMISALNIMPEEALRRALSRLTEAGLLTHSGQLSDDVYVFKHALVQDAAYDSILRSRRQILHGVIATAIEQRWPETRDNKPELLAYHFTAACMNEQAIPCWRKAGDIAMRRFALSEALTHLRKGLTLSGALPPSSPRDVMELELRTALAPAVVAQRGWGNAEVSAILEPAWALAERLEHRPAFIPVLSALWVHYLCIGQLSTCLEWAGKLLSIGAASGDDSVEIVGHRAAAASYYWLGDFAAARRHGDLLRAMYDGERHWHVAQLTNFDPLTGEGVYRGQYLWMMGFPDQAMADSDAKDEHARRRNHAFDVAFALTLGAQAFDHRNEPEKLLARAEEAERIGREHGVPLLSEMMAEISRGIAMLRAGQIAASIHQLERAITRLASTGHRIWLTYLDALRAQGMAMMGDIEAASILIDECVGRMSAAEERAHYAEVLRLQGWIYSLQRRDLEAEASLRAALEVGRAQQARGWELRSATTLAQLLMDRGERHTAWEILHPVYDWFTEGFDTKDLRDAKALLNILENEFNTGGKDELIIRQ